MRASRMLFATLLAIAHLLPSAPATAQVAPTGTYHSRFDEAACPFEASPQVLEQVRCGYLTVPQNRAEPDGKQLRLAVAVLKSTSPTPRPDPIVFLSGGPGTPSVQLVPGRMRNPLWRRLGTDRDLVFFDQRGTGYSEPELCPAATDAFFRLTFVGMNVDERRRVQQEDLARCAEAMRAEGVDLSRYSSLTSALDLQDLRRALGYREWNVYGISYGSRLALEALRSSASGIRSAVLDGPAPPNAARHVQRAQNLADVVQRLAALCAADSACDAAVPDLERRVWRTVEALDAEPLLVRGGARSGLPDPMVFDGLLFAQGLYLALYQRRFLPLLPLFVQEVERRNAPLVLAFTEPLSGGLRNIDRAMFLAVECHESAPFNGPGARTATTGRYPDVLDRIGFVEAMWPLAVCDAWHPYRAAPEQGEPVQSDIPALVLTGEFDPATHRSYGPLAALGLTRGHVVDVPGGGHGVAPIHECTRGMVAAFFDDPSLPPDRSCIDEEMETVRFITDVRMTPGTRRVASWAGPSGGSRLTGASLGLPLLVLLGSVVGWPLAAGVARLRRRERVVRTPFERRARWGAAGFALLAFGFAAGLAWVIVQTAAENPVIVLFGLPGWAAPLLVVPWILLAGSVALVATAALAWRRGAWTRWGRIHFTLVAAASLTLATLLFAWGIV